MSDYLSKEFYKEMKEEVQTRVSEHRFEHIVSVAKTAKWLGKVYGVDPKKCRLAGILHDWNKGLTVQEEQEMARKYGLDAELGDLVIDEMPHLLHGPTAAACLAERFPDMPKDVLHAVAVHTTACENMSELDMIVYVADAIEPTRDYDELEELTNSVGNVTLFELFCNVYRLWTIKLILQNRLMYPKTIEIYNDLVAKSNQ